MRSRLNAGVKGLGARLGRTSSSAGAAAGDVPSEDGSRDGSSESGAVGAPVQPRCVAERPNTARCSVGPGFRSLFVYIHLPGLPHDHVLTVLTGP